MATLNWYVHTGSSGGDGTTNATSGGTAAFASLSAAEAGLSGATDDHVIWCSGTAADTTAVTINFTTSGTITVRGHDSSAPDQTNAGSGKYIGADTISTSHYRLVTGDVAGAIVIAVQRVNIDGIQIEPGATTAGRSGIRWSTAFPLGTIKNNRLRASNTTTDYGVGNGSAAFGGANTTTIENNLFVGFNVYAIDGWISDNYAYTINMTHNTIYGDGAGGGIHIQKGNTTGLAVITMKGNAVGNTGNAFTNDMAGSAGTHYTFTTQDNAFDTAESTTDEIVLGTGSNPTGVWTSPGSTQGSQFTVKDTGSVLYNAVNPTVVTHDINGNERVKTNDDVGCFELQAAGGSAFPALYYAQMRG